MKVQLRKLFVIALLAASLTHQSSVNRCIKKAIFHMTPHGKRIAFFATHSQRKNSRRHHPTRIFVNKQAFIEIERKGGLGPKDLQIKLAPVSIFPRSRHRKIKRSRRFRRIRRRRGFLREFSSRVMFVRSYNPKTTRNLKNYRNGKTNRGRKRTRRILYWKIHSLRGRLLYGKKWMGRLLYGHGNKWSGRLLYYGKKGRILYYDDDKKGIRLSRRFPHHDPYYSRKKYGWNNCKGRVLLGSHYNSYYYKPKYGRSLAISGVIIGTVYHGERHGSRYYGKKGRLLLRRRGLSPGYGTKEKGLRIWKRFLERQASSRTGRLLYGYYRRNRRRRYDEIYDDQDKGGGGRSLIIAGAVIVGPVYRGERNGSQGSHQRGRILYRKAYLYRTHSRRSRGRLLLITGVTASTSKKAVKRERRHIHLFQSSTKLRKHNKISLTEIILKHIGRFSQHDKKLVRRCLA